MTTPRRPNILLIVSDQERSRSWIPRGFSLPNRERLMREGVEFTHYYTHASPCSPSRATLFTGLYVAQHGIHDNVIFPSQPQLDAKTGPRTLGHRLRDAGYRTAYKGKWHLTLGSHPDMEDYGFGDWEGDDRQFMGWAGTGYEYDPIIAEQAVQWLDANAKGSPGEDRPWFLTVALVNPHDVMWFPADQPDYQARNPEEVARTREVLSWAGWKTSDPLPPFPEEYPEIVSELPPNFHDDLSTKPAVQAAWRDEQQTLFFGRIDPSDHHAWKRHLDYYLRLHQHADVSLGKILDALDRSGQADDTIVLFTSDHGDMCGSHGLRSKGPFVYDEIMRVPLYVRAKGIANPGTQSAALATHADLARTVVSLGGGKHDDLPGVDLSRSIRDPSHKDHEFAVFAHDQAWYRTCLSLRYAIRGVTDGAFKYAHYYGIEGGFTQFGEPSDEPKKVPHDAPFEEQEHELYDLANDPHEVRNLARDPAYAALTRSWFERCREAEKAAWGKR